ncbi:RagB/SusD family nutrient uptake outer membrane protein [Arachidicoccus ginsenosidivorans]|uniref:RagB/SusD family nutrient uptake outer membrane protein n=1 Tax=Arachidicoccus ginsenosidivorans TaxID=496057 RepID=UPI0037423524
MRNEIDNRYLPNYLNGTAPISNYLTNVNSTTPTGFMSSKFRSPVPAQNEANQTTYDMYVFRYAEVLLIYAEAKAELGSITQGDLDISINQLRARLDEPDLPGGKMGRLTLNPPADPNALINGQPRYGYQLSPLIYEIRRERRVELAFEGFRWDDIVRWKAGKLLENPNTVYGIVASAAVQQEYDNYFGSDIFSGVNVVTYDDWDGSKKLVAPYTVAMRKWNDKLYLKPIPRDQILLSKGQIQQNPGWQ